MLGIKCSEGRKLLYSDLKQLLLPKHDPFAISIICTIVPLRNNSFPKLMAHQQLLIITMAGNKYHLGVALMCGSSSSSIQKERLAWLWIATSLFRRREIP